jgi:hypothetical protein
MFVNTIKSMWIFYIGNKMKIIKIIFISLITIFICSCTKSTNIQDKILIKINILLDTNILIKGKIPEDINPLFYLTASNNIKKTAYRPIINLVRIDYPNEKPFEIKLDTSNGFFDDFFGGVQLTKLNNQVNKSLSKLDIIDPLLFKTKTNYIFNDLSRNIIYLVFAPDSIDHFNKKFPVFKRLSDLISYIQYNLKNDNKLFTKQTINILYDLNPTSEKMKIDSIDIAVFSDLDQVTKSKFLKSVKEIIDKPTITKIYLQNNDNSIEIIEKFNNSDSLYNLVVNYVNNSKQCTWKQTKYIMKSIFEKYNHNKDSNRTVYLVGGIIQGTGVIYDFSKWEKQNYPKLYVGIKPIGFQDALKNVLRDKLPFSILN